MAVACAPVICALSRGEYLWTDVAEIGDRALVARSPSELWSAFRHGIDGHYYRPAVFALHSLNFALFGDSALAFRAVNLLLHVLNALLVYRLVREVLGREAPALATAALFAVHPLAVTLIAWASARTDLIALSCSLGFFLAARRWVILGSLPWLGLAGAVLVVGLAAKETCAATLIVTVGLLPFLWAKRRRWTGLVVLQAVIVLAWFVWRQQVSTNPVGRPGDLDVLARIAVAGSMHLEYARQLVVPYSLTVCDGTRVPAHPGPWLAAAALALAAVVLLLERARRRDPRLLVAALWAVAFLLPTSGLTPLKHVRADRYLYAALPAMIALAVTAADGLVRRLGHVRIGAALFAIAYVYLAGSLMMRASRFRSNEALWTYETRRSEFCLEGWAYRSRQAYVESRFDDALAYSLRVPATNPPDVLAFVNREEVLYYRGLIQSARGDAQTARAIFDDLLARGDARTLRAEAAYELAVMEFQRGNFPAVERFLTLSLGIGLGDASRGDAVLLRSYANLRLGRIEDCRRDFEEFAAVEARPGETRTRETLKKQIQAALGP